LACAVAYAVIEHISQPEVLAGVKQREEMFRAGLAKINQRFPIFKEVRGKGLLLGAALNDEWQGRARDVLVAAGEQGLLVLVAGANVVRFTPSLVISEEEIALGLERLEKAIESIYK
jgi:acetylornithine/N-succinyldiaminopimelate aminotransferase